MRINKFDYLPSVGASGGLLITWNENMFQGECLFKNDFSISMRFISVHTGDSWVLINIYGPCDNEGRHNSGLVQQYSNALRNRLVNYWRFQLHKISFKQEHGTRRYPQYDAI